MSESEPREETFGEALVCGLVALGVLGLFVLCILLIPG